MMGSLPKMTIMTEKQLKPYLSVLTRRLNKEVLLNSLSAHLSPYDIESLMKKVVNSMQLDSTINMEIYFTARRALGDDHVYWFLQAARDQYPDLKVLGIPDSSPRHEASKPPPSWNPVCQPSEDYPTLQPPPGLRYRDHESSGITVQDLCNNFKHAQSQRQETQNSPVTSLRSAFHADPASAMADNTANTAPYAAAEDLSLNNLNSIEDNALVDITEQGRSSQAGGPPRPATKSSLQEDGSIPIPEANPPSMQQDGSMPIFQGQSRSSNDLQGEVLSTNVEPDHLDNTGNGQDQQESNSTQNNNTTDPPTIINNFHYIYIHKVGQLNMGSDISVIDTKQETQHTDRSGLGEQSEHPEARAAVDDLSGERDQTVTANDVDHNQPNPGTQSTEGSEDFQESPSDLSTYRSAGHNTEPKQRWRRQAAEQGQPLTQSCGSGVSDQLHDLEIRAEERESQLSQRMSGLLVDEQEPPLRQLPCDLLGPEELQRLEEERDASVELPIGIPISQS